VAVQRDRFRAALAALGERSTAAAEGLA
jgi:hypothetical protein